MDATTNLIPYVTFRRFSLRLSPRVGNSKVRSISIAIFKDVTSFKGFIPLYSKTTTSLLCVWITNFVWHANTRSKSWVSYSYHPSSSRTRARARIWCHICADSVIAPVYNQPELTEFVSPKLSLSMSSANYVYNLRSLALKLGLLSSRHRVKNATLPTLDSRAWYILELLMRYNDCSCCFKFNVLPRRRNEVVVFWFYESERCCWCSNVKSLWHSFRGPNPNLEQKVLRLIIKEYTVLDWALLGPNTRIHGRRLPHERMLPNRSKRMILVPSLLNRSFLWCDSTRR